MKQVNNHVKQVMGIKNKPEPKLRYKTEYTRSILWISMVAIAVAIWITIYNLIF
jgi:hypothetical protein